MKNPLAVKPKIKYNHAEAFCHIRYRGTGIEETLWNSRDGVVPLMIYSKNGLCLMLLVKEERKRDRKYIPKDGERYLADLTKERALYLAIKIIKGRWNHPIHPLSKTYESKKVAKYLIFKSLYGEGHTPSILRQGKDVTTYMTKQFRNFIK